MPMIVDPDAPPVEPPATVTSPEGWLTAAVDEPWAGVFLAVDYSVPADTAQNLVLNPSSETNSTGQLALDIAATGQVTFTRVPGTAKYGTYSSKVELTAPGAISGGAQYALSRPVVAGETVTASLWVRLATVPTAVTVVLRNSGTGANRSATVTTPGTGSFQRVSATFVLAPGESFNRVGVAVAATGATFYVDGAMLETGAVLHPYVDGDQSGCVWDGTPHASTSTRVFSSLPYDDIRKVQITRQDPGAPAPVPVRGADLAWAVGGVGQGYDHEAPLGVGVVYSARALYADGTWGPATSLGIELPAPDPVGDVWIKSVDTPGASVRVTVTAWPQLAWASRIEQAAIAGSAFPAASQDVYGAAASEITLDAYGSAIDAVRGLLTTPGVYLLQTRPEYRRPDSYVMFENPAESLDAGPGDSRTFTAGVLQVARPDTGGQRMRVPGWSYDAVAAQYATYDAVEAAYPTYQSLALHGVL